MYERYIQLREARKQPEEFALRCDELLAVAAHPWRQQNDDGLPLDGHVPHDADMPVWKRVSSLFGCRGVYAWGAWVGAAARIQYVGIADSSTLDRRFATRYRAELRMVRKDGTRLRGLNEAFRIGEPADLDRYVKNGIKVQYTKRTRPPRAERYAKVGLEHLWYFVIPAPGIPEKDGPDAAAIREVERQLIQYANARLFAGFSRGDPKSFPLLNRTEVSPNRHLLDPSTADAYERWLREGTWWPEMNQMVGAGQ